MDAEAKRSAEDRARILAFEADYLRRELEDLTRRHHAVIYSVAWRVAWPVWIFERLFRRFRPRRDPYPLAPREAADVITVDVITVDVMGQSAEAPPLVSPPLSDDAIAARIAARRTN